MTPATTGDSDDSNDSDDSGAKILPQHTNMWPNKNWEKIFPNIPHIKLNSMVNLELECMSSRQKHKQMQFLMT